MAASHLTVQQVLFSLSLSLLLPSSFLKLTIPLFIVPSPTLHLARHDPGTSPGHPLGLDIRWPCCPSRARPVRYLFLARQASPSDSSRRPCCPTAPFQVLGPICSRSVLPRQHRSRTRPQIDLPGKQLPVRRRGRHGCTQDLPKVSPNAPSPTQAPLTL